MRNEFVKKLFSEMEEELSVFADLGTLPVRRLAGALNCVREYLAKLKAELLLHPPADRQEEIGFFKYDKPRFKSEQIYALEIYTIETARPLGDELLLKSFYEQELKFIQRFFIQYQFLYQYYQLDATELDHLLFVRGEKPSDILLPEMPGVDPEFSTACDYVFAKFMAYERLRDHLLELLSGRETAGESFVSKKGKVLKWTGETCNLIEVAYGIYDTLQLNDGDVDLTDIIDWLESTLNVNLSRFYRRFMEIKRRKIMSQTKYLDEMRAAVNKRIDDTDALQTEKRRSFRNH
jgi:hypothetical protein